MPLGHSTTDGHCDKPFVSSGCAVVSGRQFQDPLFANARCQPACLPIGTPTVAVFTVTHANMLAVIWLLLSGLVGFGQFLVLSQTDWIVHGPRHQGLYAFCYLMECQPRVHTFALFTLSAYLIGGCALIFSVILAIPYLLCSNYARPIEIAANIQLLSAFITTIALLAVPLDVGDVACTTQQLIRPMHHNCKLGWVYGIACILGLVSMSCPVFARLVADQRKTYSFVYHNQYML
uniref:G_PROTEIN_RECEP_F1_2 domain-containing protein n=1 Tax=Panagrellus redivivus TaxID=6233 RepID=A0A7E4V757_PANRE